mmetsp:Transcript_26858/g.62970  ORF Transcript_26858/g.62970 Transcript_26858/m.62970 type:complete len:220 (+) Transcript_26858:717-1376(+)
MFVHGAHGLQSSGWRHGQDPRFVDWGPRSGSGWSRSLRSIWSKHYAYDSAGHGSFSQGVRGHHPSINPDCCELLLALRIRAHAKLFVGSCGCRTACFAFFEYKRDLPPCANAEAFALRRTVSQLRLDVQQGWSQKLVVAPLAATTRLRAVDFARVHARSAARHKTEVPSHIQQWLLFAHVELLGQVPHAWPGASLQLVSISALSLFTATGASLKNIGWP